MPKWWFGGLVAALIFSAVMAACSLPSSTAPTAKPVVKVKMGEGHGSGVHIGHGYIITAAHVVGKEAVAGILATDGTERKAAILWANTVYDIALLRLEEFDGLADAKLACVTPIDGEPLIAEGNPSRMEFLALRGFVSGGAREIGPWKIAIPVDLTLIGGMSGGPVYDRAGHVVGITVGHLALPMGFTMSWVRLGMIVPGEVVCDLMARGR